VPNNAYLRGTAKERSVVNKLRAEGWVACRSAGSHSPHDVWAWHPVYRKVLLLQLKSHKGARHLHDRLIKATDAVRVEERWLEWKTKKQS